MTDMVHEMSSSAQFITTTFKPELLTRADKYYGVIYDARQKVSSIKPIMKEEAQLFVEVEAGPKE